MSRRMSVSLTLGAVRARAKTVTRRHVDTWKHLGPGSHLTLIEKGMGLPKGAMQVVVAEVEVVKVNVEPLHLVDQAEVIAEGFAKMTPRDFIVFWQRSHPTAGGDPLVRRIEWRYLDDDTPVTP